MFCAKTHIQQKFNNCELLTIDHLSIVDESHKHKVPQGAQSHFKITVVAREFQSTLPVARHQLVYKILGKDIMTKIHALGLHCYTPEEWDKRGKQEAQSPPCSKTPPS
ncbi:MAG: BolA family protein [Gammaproteobacteria bacterium]